uniref:Increased DNA methylation 3 n=1 Tax=Rhizophora mucronata TaxID=61149 RepID=A0A2P2K9B6_RHIMU
MQIRENKTPCIGLAEAKLSDQQFLLNFVMGTYLGPDLYFDNPRRSALQRLAAGCPPYTTNNLGASFLNISQLTSLYYYILRHASPDLILKPNIVHMYLRGNFDLQTSQGLEDFRQFTTFFPLYLHEHKMYSESHGIVKGIVLIDEPSTSYMKKEDLERFRYLSRMDDLKIDGKMCLNYQPVHQEVEETISNCMMGSEEGTEGTPSNGYEKLAARFQEKYKRRRLCFDTLSMQPFPHCVSTSKQHEGENNVLVTCKLGEPATGPLVEDCTSDRSIVLTGTARKKTVGPPIGAVDIGISKAAYFFQVALPGVMRDFCQFSCEIESDGRVNIQGSTGGGRAIKKRSRVFQLRFQQLCPSGTFTLSFNLPGPVDPRLLAPNFRSDGIFEAVILKRKRDFSIS